MNNVTGKPEPVRILCIHNSYQYAGGEDSVFKNETDLLESAGYVVERYCLSNESITNNADKIKTAISTIHNSSVRKIVKSKIENFRPDIVHVHNFFPQLSPSVFDACRDTNVASVWTLHNFRVTCANGLLFRDGRVCEDCVGRIPTSAVWHRCYRNSLAGSAVVAAMIKYHDLNRTWHNKVNRFIALNEHARDVFIRSGLPPERIAIKSNFSPIKFDTSQKSKRRGALFVGRLSKEKGARTLVEAWSNLDVSLTILGDGPDREELERIAPPNVVFGGFADSITVATAMSSTQLLIIPSVCYENFPMTLVEAMAAGTPVVASRLGALERIVEDGVTGFHFSTGDSTDLARVVRMALGDPNKLECIGAQAREYWQATMSPDANLKQLETIYAAAIAETALR